MAANEMFATYYLDLARYKNAKACEGLVRYNNGLALRRQHRHGEARVAYLMALEVFIEKGRTRDAGDCHQNIAWLNLLDDKPDEAFPHLQCAQSYVDILSPDYGVEMLVCWALYHYTRGEIGTAMEFVAQVMVTNQEGIESRHLSAAAWIAGEVALLLGQTEYARVLGVAAQTHALQAKEPDLMNRACQLLAKARPDAGNTGTAAL